MILSRRIFLVGASALAITAAAAANPNGRAFIPLGGKPSVPVSLPTTTIADAVIKGLSNGYIDGFNVAFPAGDWCVAFPVVKFPTAANLDYPLLSVGALSDTILTDNGSFTIGLPGAAASPNFSYGCAAVGKDDAGIPLSSWVGTWFSSSTQNGVSGPQQFAGVGDGAGRGYFIQKQGSEISFWQVDNNCCAIKTAGFQTTSFGAIASKPARLGCLGKLTALTGFSTTGYQRFFITAQALTPYQMEACVSGVDPRAVINFTNNGIDLLFAFIGNPTNGKVYTDLIQGQTATAHGTFTATTSFFPSTIDQNQIRFDIDAARVFQINADGVTADIPFSGTVYGADGTIQVQLVNKSNSTVQVAYTTIAISRNGQFSGVLAGVPARLADYRPWAQKLINSVSVGNYLAASAYFATGIVTAGMGQSLIVQHRTSNNHNVTGTLANNARFHSSNYDATTRDHYPPGCSRLSSPGYGEGFIAQIVGNGLGLPMMQLNCALSGVSIDQILADTVGFNSTSPLGVLTNFFNDIRRFRPKDIIFHQGENNLGNTYAVYYAKFDNLMQQILSISVTWGARLLVIPVDNNFSSNPNYDVNMQAVRSAQIDWVNAQIAAGNTRVKLFCTVNDILFADTDGSGIHKNATAGGYGAYAEREAQSLLFQYGFAANNGLGPTIASVQRISNTVKRVFFTQNGGTALQTIGGGTPTGFKVSLSSATPTTGPTFTSPLAISATSLTNGNTTVDITHADDGGANPYIWYQWGEPGLGTTDIAQGINNALNDNRVPAINTARGYPVQPLMLPMQAA